MKLPALIRQVVRSSKIAPNRIALMETSAILARTDGTMGSGRNQ